MKFSIMKREKITIEKDQQQNSATENHKCQNIMIVEILAKIIFSFNS